MYAQEAYQKQRLENMIPGHSPPATSDEDGMQHRRWSGGSRSETILGCGMNGGKIQNNPSSSGGLLAQVSNRGVNNNALPFGGYGGPASNRAGLHASTIDAAALNQPHPRGRHGLNDQYIQPGQPPQSHQVNQNRYHHGMASNPGQNLHIHAMNHNDGNRDQIGESYLNVVSQVMSFILSAANNLISSISGNLSTNSQFSNPQNVALSMAQISRRKRQTRALIALASLGFVGMLVLDGSTQLKGGSTATIQKKGVVSNSLNGAPGVELGTSFNHVSSVPQGEVAGELMRKLKRSPAEKADVPAHRVIDGTNEENIESTALLDPNSSTLIDVGFEDDVVVPHSKPRKLHTLPLLPKHALEHRQRRELINAKKPIPTHLVDGQEDEKFHAPVSQRRRMYPMSVIQNPNGSGEIQVVDARLVQRHMTGEEVKEGEGADHAADVTYESGALYQGYGTHYVDLWVGTPPQRQTVIIDTGSSITAFPCSKCHDCGVDSASKERYHIDPEFDETKSGTFKQAHCRPKYASQHGPESKCSLGDCIYDNEEKNFCTMSAMYAEGSSWTAKESSDIVYPSGPHNTGLEGTEALKEHGVGAGMGDITDDRPFDWMDFRLSFGCQTKITGMFNNQLEDGIMGMDNRAGAFWLQLHQHYKRLGFKKEDGDVFDPTKFSLCYDRQPTSLDLAAGVGSGQLTLGGSDSLLHHTPMVYANNVSPSMGWYTVRVKAMFLRPNAGRLGDAKPHTKYYRVDATEEHLNGRPGDRSGIIVDSGTTDTYLSESLKSAFNDAFRKALDDPSAEYHNDPIELSKDDLKHMPTILIVLQGHDKSKLTGTQPDPSIAVGLVGHPNHHREMTRTSSNHKSQNDVNEHDVVVAIPPDHYMEESRTHPGVYVSRVYFNERFGAQNIFGSNFIMGHEVLFDNGMGRVGFAESHCNYDKYLSESDALLQNEERRTEATVESNQPPAELVGANDDLHSSGWNRKAHEIGGDLRFPG